MTMKPLRGFVVIPGLDPGIHDSCYRQNEFPLSRE